MKRKDRFEETKIKMVMKLKKLGRSSTTSDIADGVKGQAAIRINRDPELMSAEEFFK